MPKKDQLSSRIDEIRDEMTARIENWLTMHNHKESIAYITLTASALLFVQLVFSYCTTDPTLRLACCAGMGACHLFMRGELMRRQRLAILIAAAEQVKAKILLERESIVESDLKSISPDRNKWPLYQCFAMYLLPLGFVEERFLAQMKTTKLYADALNSVRPEVAKLKPDFIPSIASLVMFILGLCVVFDLMSLSPFCPTPT